MIHLYTLLLKLDNFFFYFKSVFSFIPLKKLSRLRKVLATTQSITNLGMRTMKSIMTSEGEYYDPIMSFFAWSTKIVPVNINTHNIDRNLINLLFLWFYLNWHIVLVLHCKRSLTS